MRLVAALLIGAGVVLGGCSDGTSENSDGTSAAAPTAAGALSSEEAEQLIAQELQVDDDPNALTWSAAEAECAATGVVDAVGAERLQQLGLDESAQLEELDFDEGERSEVFGVVESCVDLAEQMTQSLVSGAGLEPTVAQCIAERYVASPLMEESMMSPEPDEQLNDRIDAELETARRECS